MTQQNQSWSPQHPAPGNANIWQAPAPPVDNRPLTTVMPQQQAPAEPPALAADIDEQTLVSSRKAPFIWQLRYGTQTIPLAAKVVIGRKPHSIQGYETAQLLALSDPDRTVSKNHATLELRDDLLWVTDLSSTNGTHIINQALEEISCSPGIAMPVSSGSQLCFGEFVSEIVFEQQRRVSE